MNNSKACSSYVSGFAVALGNDAAIRGDEKKKEKKIKEEEDKFDGTG